MARPVSVWPSAATASCLGLCLTFLPAPGFGQEPISGCGLVAGDGVVNLHFRDKCSPEELKQLQMTIQLALDESERASLARSSAVRNWSPGRERNLGRLGQFPTKIPIAPLHP